MQIVIRGFSFDAAPLAVRDKCFPFTSLYLIAMVLSKPDRQISPISFVLFESRNKLWVVIHSVIGLVPDHLADCGVYI